ncbi:SGNH/GDSL hydrolase family protein [Micromonospora sp. NPDC050397]|uniref:SGNH/GDSL hydrolase family protein n=1 Tax=Micromonospora sp. NPDC050397 TaxID=3364279 RepID=UPI00384D7329
MVRSVRVWLGLGLSLLATAAVTLAVSPAQAASRGYADVALGDSYSSGVGAPPYSDPTGCVRSEKAYAPLYAAANNISSFDFAACSGALTTDVLEKQLTGLGRATRLVTITIGGNDTGFSNGISACVGGTDADCDAVVKASQQFSRTELPPRLDRTYAAIRARAPQAKLVVLGYPRFFELTADCAQAPLSLTRRTALNAAVDTLDEVIASRATRARATFVDVRTAFAGHGICGAEPWLNNLAQSGPFHPNEAGYRAGYLAALDRAVPCRPGHGHHN